MQMHKHPASVVGTFTNRYIHNPSNQAFLGPHVIDTKGNVRTIDAIRNARLTATIKHLTDPEDKVYMLAMEVEFYEVDLKLLAVKQLFNLVEEPDINAASISKPRSARTGAWSWQTILITKLIIWGRKHQAVWPNGTARHGQFSNENRLSKCQASTGRRKLMGIRFSPRAGIRRRPS